MRRSLWLMVARHVITHDPTATTTAAAAAGAAARRVEGRFLTAARWRDNVADNANVFELQIHIAHNCFRSTHAPPPFP